MKNEFRRQKNLRKTAKSYKADHFNQTITVPPELNFDENAEKWKKSGKNVDNLNFSYFSGSYQDHIRIISGSY